MRCLCEGQVFVSIHPEFVLPEALAHLGEIIEKIGSRIASMWSVLESVTELKRSAY